MQAAFLQVRLDSAPESCYLSKYLSMLSQSPSLDLMFQALADPTRRLILERLTKGPATVSQLAAPFAMSLPAVVQHLGVLEGSGLVRTEKIGRVRTCRIEPIAMRTAEDWIGERRTIWEKRLDRLGSYLAQQKDEPHSGSMK